MQRLRCRLVTARTEVKDVGVTEEGQEEGPANRGGIGKQTHQRGENGAADNGHDEKRGAELYVDAEVFEAEGEDCREHDGMKKSDEDDGPNRSLAGNKKDDQ